MLGNTTSLEVRTPEGVTFTVPIASPFSRCMALAIDFAVVIALTMLVSQIIAILQISVSAIPVIGDLLSDFGTAMIVLLQFLVATLYGMIAEWLWGGQTLGKRVFKLRVIDERGLSLGLKQIVIRNLFRFLDILPSTFYLLGGICCLFTKRCQRMGDIAAGTLVIREVEVPSPEFSEAMKVEENSFARLPHLEARLRRHTTPEEARIALDAVARRNELNPDCRLRLFSQLADHFREITEFPEEVTIGLSDEQYVRNAVDSLYRRASA